MQIKILFLAPIEGNGGIQSWTKRFMATFPDEKYIFTFVENSSEGNGKGGISWRMIHGIQALRRITKDIKLLLKKQSFEIMHTTTSGDIGTLRDFIVAKMCQKDDIKTIMHCRYGCIPEVYASKGAKGKLLRKTMALYDNIWVLDRRTYNYLNSQKALVGKVFLTPNSIEVKYPLDDRQKSYKKVAFVGNLIPSKGLYELVEAVVRCEETHLDIIGQNRDDVTAHIKELSGVEFGKRIVMHGRLLNAEAVAYMKSVDIVALPSYYPSEAFPISILEAMSLSKLVISTRRAAIPDMLTALNGSECGILVREKSVDDIVDAIKWCQAHPKEADQKCVRAYEKVKSCYSTEVVYEQYRSLYDKLVCIK